MKYVAIEEKDAIGYIWLERPPYNDFDLQFIEEIIEAHNILAQKSHIYGVLLCSRNEKYFSNGMEPSYLLEQDLEGRMKIFGKLFELMKVIYQFPKLEGSVITGHAMAGGAVLGIVTDFRFMGDGKYRYSFTEIKVGLTIPLPLMILIENVIGSQNLVQATMLGSAYKPSEALKINLVDYVFPHEKTLQMSESFMRSLFRNSIKSMTSVKKTMRQKNYDIFESIKAEQYLKDFLEGDDFIEGLNSVKEHRRPVFNK